RLAVMPFISSRQTPAATGFSAPVSCPLRPRITQRGLVLLHVLADRREPGRRPIDGSNSVPIGPKMGRPRRERPIGGALLARQRRARPKLRPRGHAIHSRPATPAATGFSAPVSSALRPFIARRCFVSLHVVSDRCAPAERPNNGSTSVPIRPNMGRSRRGRPVDGALPGRHRRARRWIRLPSYHYDFQPTNLEGEE